MAKRQVNPFEVLLENASEKTSKSKSKIPVIACEEGLSSRVVKYLDLMAKEAEIKAEKDDLGQLLRDEARSLYASTILEHKTDVPSSVRLVADQASVLYLVQDAYAKVTPTREVALREAGLGEFIDVNVTIDFSGVDEALQKKVAKLLTENLSKEEQRDLISTERVIAKGSFAKAVEKSRTLGQVLQAIELLSPTQQLKKG